MFVLQVLVASVDICLSLCDPLVCVAVVFAGDGHLAVTGRGTGRKLRSQEGSGLCC